MKGIRERVLKRRYLMAHSKTISVNGPGTCAPPRRGKGRRKQLKKKPGRPVAPGKLTTMKRRDLNITRVLNRIKAAQMLDEEDYWNKRDAIDRSFVFHWKPDTPDHHKDLILEHYRGKTHMRGIPLALLRQLAESGYFGLPKLDFVAAAATFLVRKKQISFTEEGGKVTAWALGERSLGNVTLRPLLLQIWNANAEGTQKERAERAQCWAKQALEHQYYKLPEFRDSLLREPWLAPESNRGGDRHTAEYYALRKLRR